MAYSISPSNGVALPLWKRSLDVTCCVLALPLLAVAAFWTLVLTRISSPGPILFRQERVGCNGRRFFLYKFRTMHVSASVSPHQAHFSQMIRSNEPMEKLDVRHDTRLIPGGWLLRASGLDELPQVINVLRGEMTVVGPRPCIPYELEQYTERQRDRLKSVPGLTGLWQVSGKNRTTFDEMVQLDIKYGEKLSLRGDLWIIVRTLPAVWMQITDTRRARGELEQLSMPRALALEESQPRSATTLLNSRNVMSRSLDDSVRLPARAARVSYEPIRQAFPRSRGADGIG